MAEEDKQDTLLAGRRQARPSTRATRIKHTRLRSECMVGVCAHVVTHVFFLRMHS